MPLDDECSKMMNVLEGRMKWFKDLTQDLEVSLPRSMFRRFVGFGPRRDFLALFPLRDGNLGRGTVGM